MVISFATVVACSRLWRVRGYRVFTAGALRLPALQNTFIPCKAGKRSAPATLTGTIAWPVTAP
ncbi:hypothetical protein FZI22_06275 [Cronobacter sakazakii]|nr:hypothetical protein FZI22_06275 [Cronobacter sakazakii]